MQLRTAPFEVWLDSRLQGVLPLAAADRDIWCVPAAAEGSCGDRRPLQRDWGGAIRIKCSANQTLNHSVIVAVSPESSKQ
jgi:LSD1 subclass zinc finger protein